jgi:hypothetical protein
MEEEKETVLEVTVASFLSRDQAERAVEMLQRANFHSDQIGFATPGGDHEPSDLPEVQKEKNDRTILGAATGGVSGWVLGSFLGALAVAAIPGVGPILAGGGLAAILAGAAGGAVAGGIVGALTGLGVPAREAKRYEEELRKGRTLVTISAGERYIEAQNILRDADAATINVYGH